MSAIDGYTKLLAKANQIVKTVSEAEFLQKKEALLPYAYPCDNYVTNILYNKKVADWLKKLVDNYYKEQNITSQTLGYRVNKTDYPNFTAIFEECVDILKVSSKPQLMISNRLRGINALTLNIENTSYILISPQTTVSLTPEETKFLLGHEIGHILQGNLVCHAASGILRTIKNKYEVLGDALANVVEVPLKEWCRTNEYTADRAGYLCCKNIDSVYSLFSRMGNDSTRTIYSNYMEIYRDHPYIKDRIDRINEFKDSIKYKIN